LLINAYSLVKSLWEVFCALEWYLNF
jgi:hypothetical protein